MKFDSQWRKACAIEPCPVSYVDGFLRLHYLKKRPAIVTLCVVMLHNRTPVGCAVFAAPPRECEVRYGGKGWELARLFILDEIPRNAETWLIAQSVRLIKLRCDVDFLVSYADPSAGHRGTIYYAANWTYDGMTDSERKTPRADYVDARTGKKYGRRGNMQPGSEVERVARASKHRFYLKLNRKRGAVKVASDYTQADLFQPPASARGEEVT